MRRHRPNFLLIATIGCVLSFTGPAHAQGGMIVNATYGAGNRQVNVTSRVQSMVQNGWLNFQVSPQTASVSDRHWESPRCSASMCANGTVRLATINSRTFRS